MTEAFRINGVDRGTIKMTVAIAELNIVDPVTFDTLKYDPATEILQSFAKWCATHITPDKKRIIEDMKATQCQCLKFQEYPITCKLNYTASSSSIYCQLWENLNQLFNK